MNEPIRSQVALANGLRFSGGVTANHSFARTQLGQLAARTLGGIAAVRLQALVGRIRRLEQDSLPQRRFLSAGKEPTNRTLTDMMLC
ncbi:MAG: hypothetical protein ACK4HB_05195 [Candidatus Bipolaricaulia bacterium]